MKEEGTPLSTVLDKSFVAPKVIAIPRSITPVKSTADITEEKVPPEVPIKNMVSIAMSAGYLPLQGTKLFVSIARSRSLGESMIRHPTTPAALHPKPMHMVSVILQNKKTLRLVLEFCFMAQCICGQVLTYLIMIISVRIAKINTFSGYIFIILL